MDFGFPILRGIYLRVRMVPYPDVAVQFDKQQVDPTVISNSTIYGIIRRDARETVEKGIAADTELARRAAALRAAWPVPKPPKQEKTHGKGDLADLELVNPSAQDESKEAAERRSSRKPTADYQPARGALRAYLTTRLHWSLQDAALLVEYAGLDLGMRPLQPHDRWDVSDWLFTDWNRDEFAKLSRANLGPLAAIGEQKATQLLARLASRFEPSVGTAYEAISPPGAATSASERST